MIQLVGPLRVAQPMVMDDQEAIVALYVTEPDDAWIAEFVAVHALPEGPERDAAAEALFAPERIAAYVADWEGVAAWDREAGGLRPAPYSREAFVSACAHKAFYALAMSAVGRALAGRAVGNCAPSPAGSTGEGPDAAAAADRPPSDAA